MSPRGSRAAPRGRRGGGPPGATARRMSAAMSPSASDSGTPSSSACSWAATKLDSCSEALRSRSASNADAAAGAELHLAQREQHLLPHRAAERLGHAGEREPVAEAGPHGHRRGCRGSPAGRARCAPGAAGPAARCRCRARTSRSRRRSRISSGEEPPRLSSRNGEAEQDGSRRLVADEALHGDVAGAPGEVQPAPDRLPLGRAHGRRQARARACRPATRSAAAAVPRRGPPSAARACRRSIGPRSRRSGIASRPIATHSAARKPASSGVTVTSPPS